MLLLLRVKPREYPFRRTPLAERKHTNSPRRRSTRWMPNLAKDLRGTVGVQNCSGHNTAVRRFRCFWLLALLAVLYTTLAPQALASWACEGRTCGTSFWACCCIGPETAQDGNCRSEVSIPDGEASAACPAECNCVLTVTSAHSPRPSTPAHELLPVFVAALLPLGSPVLDPLPTEALVQAIETRGPPIPVLCLATPVLRGPPVLMLPVIGVRAAASGLFA